MIDDKIGVIMNYPNSSSLEEIEGDNFTVGMNLIKRFIKMIFTAEQTHERDSFTDEELDEFLDSLNSEQFQSIRQFFDTMPKVKSYCQIYLYDLW